jgi:threonine dehydrogenase-like Zn-dependent dehydrogenase
MHEICMKNITLKGGVTDQHYMQFLMDCVKEGKINVDHIVTHVMPLKDFDKGMDYFAHKKDGCIKLVFKP